MRLISRRVTNWVLEHIQLNSKQHLAIKVKVLFLHFLRFGIAKVLITHLGALLIAK